MPEFLRNELLFLYLKTNLSLKFVICISCEIQKNVHNYLLLLLCQVLLSSNKIAKLN